tara:strand:- start:562 stop:1659 length:1098 start_codon:yes stop_codon:yes gene_type:complete
MATNPPQARDIASRLPTQSSVVKAQIHAGGRGKGGGVKLAKSPEEAESLAKEIIGMTLVTHQTGPKGRQVSRVLIEEGMAIERELYLSIIIDRTLKAPVVIASSAGGMDIEEVATSTPEQILRVTLNQATGVIPFQARKLAFGMGLNGTQANVFVSLLQSIYKAFIDTDASLIEINPLIVTGGGDLLALDAKVSFDDNALYRHKDLQELRDLSEEDPLEVEASKHSLNYIRLDGNIGCMVNGAGLAMATMDIIKLSGGEPANFLDVGGGANADQIKNAFRILVADTKVKAVLINIFGGILRCDVLAKGVIAAVTELSVDLPIVVRMEGTNVDVGRQLLEESTLNFSTADSMAEAANKVVSLASKK